MITPKQIRAARALLGWSQQELANALELSKPTIVDAEKEGHQSRYETLGNIQKVLENQGLEFVTGGVRERDDILTVFEGEKCIFDLVDKMQSALKESGEKEILYYGADQGRSSASIVNKLIEIKKSGVVSKYLIKNNDTHIMDDISQYKWMPDKLWMDTDAKVIFTDIVAYAVTWQSKPKIICLRDKRISDAERKIFDFVWDISAKPTHSTAQVRY